ncbi:MAG: hypothetical protein PVG07_03075 [Acidobacteriota bacterium]|jgi:hypothetical protein
MSENDTDGENRPTRAGEGLDEGSEGERPSDESRRAEGEAWRYPEEPDDDIEPADGGGGGPAGTGTRGDEDLPPPEPHGPTDLAGEDDGEQPH